MQVQMSEKMGDFFEKKNPLAEISKNNTIRVTTLRNYIVFRLQASN